MPFVCSVIPPAFAAPLSIPRPATQPPPALPTGLAWPLHWARHLVRQQLAARRRLERALADAPAAAPDCADALRRWQAAPATAAFDAARDVYAARAAARPSLLASARFERGLGWAEAMALGPWSRRV